MPDVFCCPHGVWWISWVLPNQLQMKWTIASKHRAIWSVRLHIGHGAIGGEEVTARIDTSNWHCGRQNQHNHDGTHTTCIYTTKAHTHTCRPEKQQRGKEFRWRWFATLLTGCSFYAFGLENKLPRLFVPTNPLIAVLGLLYAGEITLQESSQDCQDYCPDKRNTFWNNFL